LLFLVCSLGSSVFAENIPGQIMVKFRKGVITAPRGVSAAAVGAFTVNKASIRALNTRRRISHLRKLYVDTLALRPDWIQLDNQYVLTFPGSETAEIIAQDFQQDENVVSAKPIPRVKAFETTPNDPNFSGQWGLTNIQATRGWDRTTGESSTVVAVLDTGIDYTHPDLMNKVDLVNAKNYVNHTDDPMDDHPQNHGSAVSGVIAAQTNNGIGVAGLDWGATILPIKVLDASGGGSMTAVCEGLAWATAQSVEVINMSFGQYTSDVDMQQRCLEAYQAGIVLVAAAGNDNVSNPSYPSSYSTVLAVAAVDSSDKRSVWNATQASNYGSWVDVAAPGTDILTTRNSAYNTMSGTSLACPFVAGLAALTRTTFPTLSNEAVMQRIKSTTDNIDAANPDYVGMLGTGRINVYSDLSSVSAIITSPESNSHILGEVNIYGSASGNDFLNYRIEGYLGGSFFATLESSSTSVESGLLGVWDTGGLNGAASIELLVYSNNFTTAETGVSFYIDNLSPEANISSPTDGATITASVPILGTAKDINLHYYTLDYKKSGAVIFQNIRTASLSVESNILGTWETSGLSGEYSLRLSVFDHAGNSSSETISVNVQASSSIEKKANSQILPYSPPDHSATQISLSTYAAPNPFDRAATSEVTFNYSLASNFNCAIYLFDLTGTLLWQGRYNAGENGGKAGANNPSWDGRSLFGSRVANGVYLYQIVADSRILARGKLSVF